MVRQADQYYVRATIDIVYTGDLRSSLKELYAQPTSDDDVAVQN